MTGTTSREEVVVADFNNDDKPDISDGQYVWLGAGDGTFGDRLDVPSQNTKTSVVSADFDGDGNTDLVTSLTNWIGGARFAVAVMLGRGDGTFTTSQTFSDADFRGDLRSWTAHRLLVGNFNGDDRPDLLVFPVSTYGDAGLRLLLNEGDGSFAMKRVEFDQDWAFVPPHGVAAADVNSDGIDDVLYGAGNDGVFVALGTPEGTLEFDFATPYGVGYKDVSVGDLNGDGHLDFVSKDLDYSPGDDRVQIAVALGRGDGTFDESILTELPFLDVGSEYVVNAESDLNGDGIDDVAVLGDQWMYTLVSEGDGTFEAPITQITNVSYAKLALTADVDGDGDSDIVAYGLLVENSESVSVFLNKTGEAVQKTPTPPVIGFDKFKTGVTEAGKKAKFRVVRQGDQDRDLKVKLAFAGDAKYRKDYTLKISGKGTMKGKKLVIPAGKKAVRVKIIPVDDRQREGTESIDIEIVLTAAIRLPGETSPLKTQFSDEIIDDDLLVRG
ncbi:MAG: VCBS repeat-containing protein [Planctomycetota bacterium]